MKKNIIKNCQGLCKEHDAKLIYLCIFGSHLYGTNTPESDFDFKGLFLPSKESCFLGKAPKSISRSTGSDVGKNTKEDTDVQLWSLQYFLELASKGETNAMDLLYSHTYPEMVLYQADPMPKLFENHDKVYNIKDCNAYIGYAMGQAKKYGIKGSRLGVLKNIKEWLEGYFAGVDHWGIEELKEKTESEKLNTIIHQVIDDFKDPSYCFTKEINGIPAIVILGKVHLGTITIGEFRDRIYKDYDQYGERAEAARRSDGLDFKALSHAVRALIQMAELIANGKIQYPLADADTIKNIKNGQLTFDKIEELIGAGIESIKSILAVENLSNKKDPDFVKNLILKFYTE